MILWEVKSMKRNNLARPESAHSCWKEEEEEEKNIFINEWNPLKERKFFSEIEKQVKNEVNFKVDYLCGLSIMIRSLALLTSPHCSCLTERACGSFGFSIDLFWFLAFFFLYFWINFFFLLVLRALFAFEWWVRKNK